MEETTDYIFSINTGRSGSEYLKTIFDHVLGARAFHEPQPIGNDEAMRQFSQGYLEPMRRIAQEKVETIKGLKHDCRVYVETNHCFIKGFGWFMPQILPEASIGVIVLKREVSKIAESTLRIGCSPLSPFGRQWLILPDKKVPLIMPPTVLISSQVTYLSVYSLKFLFRVVRFLIRKVFQKELKTPKWFVDYELECLKWYVQETDAQAEAFKRRFPGIKYYEVNIEDLNSLKQVEKMLAYFGCSGNELMSDIVGKRTNQKH